MIHNSRDTIPLNSELPTIDKPNQEVGAIVKDYCKKDVGKGESFYSPKRGRTFLDTLPFTVKTSTA